jgi:beta-N-acetylhexosaminidase
MAKLDREAVREGARLLVVGVQGTSLTDEERRLLADLRPGGVIVLPRNVGASAEELSALVAELRATVPAALLCVDAEGGRVDRLRRVVAPAPAAAELALRPAVAAGAAGAWIGRALRLFDFDVDFAPVVDLDYGLADNALDRRYLGSLPQAVIPRARAFLRGLHAAGVAGCLKHFPGLGAARADTHREGTVIERSRAELALDLAPFAALAPAAGAVMASHGAYPALDPERRPATLSPPIATALLREELGFRGVLFSDDLEMGALEPWGGVAERPAAALAAGCDALALCHTLAAAGEAAQRLASPRLAVRRAEALARLGAYREHLAGLRRPRRRRYRLATVRARLLALGGEATGEHREGAVLGRA